MGRDIGHRAEKILHSCSQSGTRVAEQVGDLVDLRRISVELTALRLRQRKLIGEGVAVEALYRVHRHPLTDVPGTSELRNTAGLNDLLTAETGGRRIAD